MIKIKAIRDRIKDAMDHAQSRAEAAEVQLNLGKADAEDRFKEQYKELVSLAGDLTEQLAAAGNAAADGKDQLQTAVTKLEVQVALGAMDSRDAMEALKQEIEKRTKDFDTAIDAAKPEVETAVENIETAMTAYVRKAKNLGSEIEARLDNLSKGN